MASSGAPRFASSARRRARPSPLAARPSTLRYLTRGVRSWGAKIPPTDRPPYRLACALARALVNRPKVLLLDEPLGALDLKLREQMQEELKALQKSLGITFVFVTHDQSEALSMADRIAVFDHGRVMQVGAPQDIYRRPVSRLHCALRSRAKVCATGERLLRSP